VIPQQKLDVLVYSYRTPKTAWSEQPQASTPKKTPWWKQRPNTPIRDQSKGGGRTHPDLDKL
jgi:hypothetical protein